MQKVLRSIFMLLLAAIGTGGYAQTAPFTQSFNTTTIPSGWSSSNNCSSTSANALWKYGGAMGYDLASPNHPGDHSGTSGYWAWVDGSSPYPCKVTLRTDSVDISNLTSLYLEFWLLSYNVSNASQGYNEFTVDFYDGTQWNNSVYYYSGSSTSPAWQYVGVDLSTYTTSGKVMFRFNVDKTAQTPFYNDIAIDDVSVKNAPPCPLALNLAVKNITSSGATLTWNAVGAATSYNVLIGTQGFNPALATPQTATTDSLVATGLTSSTTYDVYVVANCGTNGYSDTTGPVSFTTICTTQNMPITETFTTWPPNCYSFTGTSSWNWQHNSAGYAQALFWNYSTGSAFMTSGAINITQPAQVKFKWAHLYNSFYPEDRVLLRVKIVGSSQWDTLIDLVGPTFTSPNASNTSPPPSASDFVPEILYLDSATYVGQTVQFEFVAITDFGPNLYIDDFVVEAVPPCPVPVQLNATNITSSTATINWSILSGGQFLVEYGPPGFIQGTGVVDTVTTNSALLTGLASNTLYDVYVLNDCSGSGNGYSAWAGPYTFRTTCSPFAEGYFENFDALTSNSKDPCWYDFTVGGAHTVYALTPSTFSNVQPYSPPNLYYWYNAGATTSYVVTPELLGLDGDTTQIRFRMTHNYFTTPGPAVWIGTMSDRTNANTIVWVDTINPAQYVWNEYTLPLTNVPTGHKYVVFGRSNAISFSEVDIDNFHFEGIPACPPPLSATANALSPTSVVVSWSGISAGLYNIEYGPTGFVQGTGPVITGVTSPDTLTGLFANTCYDVYIQKDCGSGSTSPWFGPINVCTPCIASNMPYSEDFNTWPPSCFSFTKTANWDWDQDPAGHARARFWTYNSGKASMTTGQVNITQKAQVKFKWAHQYQTFYPDDRVILLSRVSGSAQWDTLVDLKGPSFNTPNAGATTPPPLSDFIPELIYLDSATYVGQVAEFRFDALTDYGPHAYVDDFVVEAVPACPDPTQLSISAIQGYQATLNWSSAGGSQFVIEYGPQGFSQGTGGGIIDTVSGSPAIISGLTPVTCYDVYVMALCGSNGNSTWAGPVSFCTLVSCPAPTNINAGSITTTTATISWTTGSASNWNYIIGPFGTTPGTGTVMQTTSNPLTLTGLAPATAYVFWLQDSCGPGDVSTWAGPYNFSTLCNTFTLNYSEDFTTWAAPNPPTCWNNQGGTTQAILYTSGTNKMARFNFWSWFPPADAMLTSPAINISQKARLKFSWARNGTFNYSDKLIVLAKPTTNTQWDTVAIWTDPGCQCGAGTTTPGTLIDTILPLDTNYVGQDIQVRFWGISDWGPDLFLDNIVVEVDPQFASCPAPQSLSATSITSSSASLGWTSTATNYQVSYGPGTFPANQGTLVTTANNPYSLTGLSGNTTYSFYVRALCGAGDTSVWNGPFSFTTACASYTLPFADNLDGTSWVPDNINFSPTSDVVDQCWTRTPAGTAYSWRVRSIATGSSSTGPSADVSGTGNYIYTEASNGLSGDQAQIISPIIDMSGAIDPYLRFYYHFYGTQINRIYVEGYNGTTWAMLDSIVGQQQLSSSDPWQDTLVSLLSYAGTANFQFRLRAISMGCCAGDLAVDEFSVFDSSSSACPGPTNFATSSIACDSTVMTWNSDPSTLYSVVLYGPAGFNPQTGGTLVVPAVSPLTINGLTPSTAYDVYLLDSCSAGTSVPQMLNITTPNAPMPVVSFTTNQTSTTATSADVDFDATGSSNYTSVLWDFGGGNTSSNAMTTFTYTMNQTYAVTLTLTNGCGTVDSTFDVTVTGIGIEENELAQSVIIYPNPTSGAFTVQFNLAEETDATVFVLDAVGREVYKKALGQVQGEQTLAMDLEYLAAGVYMIQLETELGSVTKRITVRK